MLDHLKSRVREAEHILSNSLILTEPILNLFPKGAHVGESAVTDNDKEEGVRFALRVRS